MTVVVQTPYNAHLANGVSTTFGFTFQLLQAADLQVSLNGVVQPGSGYSISGLGVEAGGSINFTGGPPENGTLVEIERVIPLSRSTDYQYNGDLPEAILDLDFDRLWQALQDAAFRAGLTIKLPPEDPAAPMTIPGVVERASKFFAFNALGEAIAALGVPEAPTSAFMATVLDDPDAATARATLGAAASGSIGASGITTATARILGRVSVGVGPVEELTPSQVASLVAPSLSQNLAQRNPIINGQFWINQRLPSSNADDTYAHDRWYVLTQTGAIAVSTLTDVEDGTPFMARLTQSQVTAQRMGYADIMEGKFCKHLRGKQVTFRFGRSRLSASANVRYAVLEWTGTEDAVTSDVVNNWTSGTYTAGNFFLGSNLTVSGVAQQAMTANTLADGTALTVTLGSSFNNLIVLAWTEGTIAQNGTLDLAKAQISIGEQPLDFEVRSFQEELALCQRYYFKTFPQGVAPAQNVGSTNGCISCAINSAAGANSMNAAVSWTSAMRANPATVTTYNPQAANANWRNSTNSADYTATVSTTSDRAATLIAASVASGLFANIHLTADAEL